MTRDIIERLRVRIATSPSTDCECVPPIVPGPTLNEEAILSAEEELGFRLPGELRALYLHVANGGFGPGWGILSLNEVVEWDHICRAEDGYPPPNWPDKLIRFCEWGCNFWSGVDCASEQCPIIRFDPDKDVIEMADSLIPESASLAEWLTSWLDGTLNFNLNSSER